MPLDGPRPEEIRAALDKVLAWPGLVRSPQLGRFLGYVVDAHLRGDAEAIKAYAIAVDVFRRPNDFDPQRDPIVRVQARRLRALLDEYYAADGAGDPVRIRMPVGRYVPDFERVTGAEAADSRAKPEPSRVEPVSRPRIGSSQTPLIVALGAVTVGLIVSLILFIGAPRAPHPTVPQAPSIAIADFQVVAGSSPAVIASVTGLAVQLARDLQLFEDIGNTYLTSDPPQGTASPTTTFVLAGLARAVGDAVQITATLRPAGSDVTIWSQTVEAVASSPSGISSVSRALAERLGSLRGPLHAAALQWLANNKITPGSETDYACYLLFGRYRDSAADADRDRARECIDRLLDRLPDSATGLALSAGLSVDEALEKSDTPGFDQPTLAAAKVQLAKARGLASTSSIVWEQWALLAAASGDASGADKSFAVALQLNPADLDVMAEYARLLAFAGESPRGRQMAGHALGSALSPPPWYHAAVAVNAFRSADDKAAVTEAEALSKSDGELGPAVAAAAAQRGGNQAALDRDVAQVLEAKRFRRFGVGPVLRQRLADGALVSTILEQLRAAGVPQAALDGPF